jgi:glycyl-tRNA synthetase
VKNLYTVNGLVFWSEREIRLRERFRDYFAEQMRDALLAINPAWRFLQVEAPLLTPRVLVNKNYTHEDIYVQVRKGEEPDELVLRPETTPGTYQWVRAAFDDTGSGIRPPVCVWQAGKSFRREQDQPTKHVRLKEFHQQEFQCVFTTDTANDYHAVLVKPVEKMIRDVIGLPTRVVTSDRLPDYSKSTLDVEVDNGDKWMEVCSMSLRTDFPGTVRFSGKGKTIERELLVAEVAIGLDRCVYNFLQRADA